MKKNVFLTLVLILITWIGLLGQKSNKTLNYQAVILDPKAIDIPGASIVGQPLSKGNVCLRFSLLNGQGGLDYEETQSVTTDEYGLVNVAIGAGAQAQANNSTSVYKSFDSIVWNSSVKSLKVSVSYDGCSSFKQVSSQALNYTPYALYSEAVDYKNVRDAPTKLSQFSNDAGYLIPKDLDPLKAEITFNTDQLATANKTIADNKKSSDAAFLIVNQSITSLDMKVAENTSSIGTINTKITDQQNQINDSRNQISAANAKLTDQQNQINDSRNQITATNNSLNSQIGGLESKINAESLIARAAELTLTNNLAAKSASIAANTNELALKANSDNPRLTGIVAVGTTNPSVSAVLDINSTSQGMLVPRMTTVHRNAIVNPATALLIYNTSNNTFEVYKSSCSCWVSLSDGGGSAATNLENNAPTVSTINYKGVYRAGGTANVVYTYSDSENDAEAATTILWEIANDNQGTAKTTYSTSATPTFGEANAGRYVRVKITPRASTGVLNGIDYYGSWTLIDAATVPYGTAVSISGNAEQGSLLTALYTFNGGSGTENTLGSTYTWQTATSNKGANTQTMSVPGGGAAFGKTIRPAINEVNKYVRFGVRAKDNASVTASSFVYSEWVGPINLASEAAPLATNVSYSPAPGTNVELKASYTYVDANNDPEATSLYQWYTANDATGASQAPISNATTMNFTPTSGQASKYIGFGITPKASTGTATGAEVVYYSSTPSVAAAGFTIVSVTQSSTNFYINRVMDATDYITVRINVTSQGAIAFSTPTVNGYSFSNGGVYTTGEQNVILYANGTQTAYNAAGDIFNITAVGSSTQNSSITISNTNIVTSLANNAPTVSNINYRGVFRINGTASVVYTYADAEKDLEGATTIHWEMADNTSGLAKTTYSTSATPTFTELDGGKWVRVKITPRAATGVLNGVDYYGGWTLVDVAAKPYATSVNVTGKTEQGSTLTGSYTFNGGTNGVTTFTENTSGSNYVWQTALNNIGVGINNMAVPDGGAAFGKTIRPTINDVNKYVRFGVQANDNVPNASTNYVYSDWVGPITFAAEAAPVVKNVSYSPAPGTNIMAKASYTFEDANYDPEGASTYQWYSATAASGANQTAITGATSKEFFITNDYAGKYIGVGITPKALTGNQTGTEVVYYAPTTSTPAADFTFVSATQNGNYFHINRVMAATDTITVRINVTKLGSIKFTTNTENGYSFSAYGVYNPGLQNVTLKAKGKQLAYSANGDNFTITGLGSTSITTPIVINNVKLGIQFTDFKNGIVDGVHNTTTQSEPTYYTLSSYTTGESFNSNITCRDKPISASACVGTSITVGSNTYSITTINGQCWMQQNLKELPNGAAINASNGTYGYFNAGLTTWGLSETIAGEGLIYYWNAAMLGSTIERTRGVCPAGWHIPSDCEWMYLEHGLGMGIAEQERSQASRGEANINMGTVSYKLRSSGEFITNASGFSGLLTGRREAGGGNFSLRGNQAFYWSSTNIDSGAGNGQVWARYYTYNSKGINRNYENKSLGSVVRCLKD